MNINDYNEKLSKHKSKTSDRLNDLRNTHNKQLADLREVNRKKQAAQLRTFNDDKRNLENDNRRSVERHRQATADAITEKTNQFKNKLKEKQGEFDTEITNTSVGLRTKLKNLKTAFRKAKRQQRLNTDKQIRDSKETFKSREKRNLNDYQTNLHNQNEKTRELVDKVKQANAKEFNSTVKKHQNEVLKIEKDNTAQKRYIANKTQKDRTNLIENNKQKNELRQLELSDKVDSIRKKNNLDKVNLERNYKGIINQMAEDHDLVTEKQRRFNEEQKVKTDIGHNNELRNIRTENTQRVTRLNDEINGGGSTKGRLVSKYEHKIDKLVDKLKQQSYKNTSDKERIQELNKSDMKKISEAFNDKIEEDQRATKKYTFKQKEAKAKQSREILDSYKTRLSRQEIDNEQQALAAKVAADRRINSQKSEFNSVIKQMTDKNVEAIETLQKENAQEKTQVIENLRKLTHQEKEDIKSTFNRKITKKEQSYEQQLLDINKRFDKMVNFYEKKIQNLTSSSLKERERLNLINTTAMEAKVANFKNEMDLMNKKFFAEKLSQKDLFERRLARQKNHSDIYLNKVVEKYEAQLIRQKDEAYKEKKANELRVNTQFQNLYRQNELEKRSLRQQMQSRLEGLKNQIESKESTLDQFKSGRA